MIQEIRVDNLSQLSIDLILGTRVMFLHNHLFSNGLHNGSIGAVLEIPDEENILVVFPLAQGISCAKVIKETVYFNIYGSPA
ncbi:hypothetical protein Glove_198g7 [Diversispora epigaea]|uniref:Uncharacterized protein n=1 Tax=Diversispora epigaea TaxID=1348612 RepID=A0A397IK74_9GLOM|nr:hypothetical protein Glove_198g7 [Diversispora epigaea]